jgi:hypothetical protein
MAIQNAAIELFGACDDNSCTSSAERVVPYNAPASTAWETIAANYSVVYGEVITAQRAEEIGSMLASWSAEMLLAVKSQLP